MDAALRLVQQVLQSANPTPVSGPDAVSAGLAQEVTAALLASMSPPQAGADATPAPAATNPPVATQSLEATPSTAPSSAPPATVASGPQTSPDAFAMGSSPAFAEQTALRFGAGVVSQAALAATPTDVRDTLVRDATNVLRLGNLQPHAGGPGPGAFAHPQASTQRFHGTYQVLPALPATPGSSTVDLTA